MSSLEDIRSNLLHLRETINTAALNSGRNPEDVTVVGITKRKSVDIIRAALEAGLTDIGENRIQEVREKFPSVDFGISRRHFVGHLQSNKVKYLPGLIDIVQSVDSPALAERLHNRFNSQDSSLPVYLQVNISGEASKSGVAPEALSELTGYCLTLKGLEVQGFMTIGPLTTDRNRIRDAFMRMYSLCDRQATEFRGQLASPCVSMGMSGDFDIAIEEGATHIRVGTALFGPRE